MSNESPFFTAAKQRKIAKYYKAQERLLQDFNEVDAFTELGCLPGSLTEVCDCQQVTQIWLYILLNSQQLFYILLQDEMKQVARNERMAIYISNIANLVLFIAKVYASVESRSLAVIASTLDSLLDLLSGFILWFTAYAMKKPNRYRYPIGKNRMQPVVSILTLAPNLSR